MADVNSNININFNTAAALAQLRSLQAGLSRFHQSLAEGNLAAANAQKGLNAQLLQSIGATGKFSASQVKVAGSTLAFTSALEKNKLSLREYYRYTMAAATANTRVMGKAFAQEREIINRARRDRVKALQAQYIQMNKSNSGFMDAIRVMPKSLAMANGKFTELGTRIQYAAQRQQFLNQLLKQGSTQLLNFGKNTQWAGRQLMVGLTMPLALFGSAAAKTFRDLEKEIVKFKRVYGNAFTNDAETDAAVENIRKLASEYTKYGVSVTKTVEMAASAAAAGFSGSALNAQVETATKLAVLGQIEQQQALETTISLQSAFGISSEDLAKKINFLNAVENQTLLSIEDLTIAIPKAAPVIKQLGGSVEDLAFFLTAMKEGGINASEGANALKSGLASLINPSDKAAKFLGNLGVNIKGIVESNKGDIKATVVGFAQALDTLDPLNRARAIEQMFGKFQFARLSTLFQNVTKDGSQASRAFDLAGKSVEELAVLSEREMKKIEDSVGVKFQAAIEQFKQDIMPLGKIFLEALTPVVKFFGSLFEKFNGLSDSTKKVIAIIVGAVAGLGPIILMTFGLLANGIANVIKFFAMLRAGIARLNGQTNVMGAGFNYMTQEQIENAASSQQLHQTHTRLIEVFNVEATSVNALASSYNSLSTQMRAMASQNPALFAGGLGGAKASVGKLPPVRKYKDGILTVPGPKGAGDIQPAMLAPGEAVIPADTTDKYRGLISAMFNDKVPGFMAGRLPGARVQNSTQDLIMQKIQRSKSTSPLHSERQSGATFVGMPKSAAEASQSRQILEKISNTVKSGKFGSVEPTNFGTLLQPFSGRSFPARGVGGVYRKPNGEVVVVKPTIDEKTALAEVRATQISREVHGLVSPKQNIKTMIDPTDPSGQRKFIVIESPYDPRIAAMSGKFTKSDMVKQLVASTLRGDKDLQKANLSGNILSDVGTAGVFDRASGFRDFAKSMPSMEQQAVVNLLGVKGGAKKFFAQETSGLAAGMSPAQYDAAIKAEINRSIPRLENVIKSWNLNPEEKLVYGNMLKRLKAGAVTDWSKLQPMHARAGEGIIKAIDGIDPKASRSVIEEQLAKYSLPKGTQTGSLIDDLKRNAQSEFVRGIDKLDPQRRAIVEAAWKGGKVSVPPSGKEQAFNTPRQTTFLNEISSMVPVRVGNEVKYIHKDDYNAFKADPDGRARYARSSKEVIDNMLYRMGVTKRGDSYVAGGKFTGRFAGIDHFKKDLMSTGKASGGFEGNVKKEFRKPLKIAQDEYNKKIANDPRLIKMMTDAGLTPAEARAELKAELSHIKKTGESGRGSAKWLKGTALFDSKIVNRYMNSTNRLSQQLDWNKTNGYSLIPKAEVAKYYEAAAFMKTGRHPANSREASLLALAIDADKRALGNPSVPYKTDQSLAKLNALGSLLQDRAGISSPGFYDKANKYNLGSGNLKGFVLGQVGEYLHDKSKKTLEKITRSNSKTPPSNVKPDTGNKKDNRLIKEGANKSVVTKTQAAKIATGRGVRIIPGRDAGDPNATLTPYQRQELKKISAKNPEMSESQLRNILKRKLKADQNILDAKEKEVAAARKAEKRALLLPKQEAARQAKLDKIENQRQSRLLEASKYQDKANKMNERMDKKKSSQQAKMARQEKVGRFSGGASMALGTAGMGLMMAGQQNAGMAVMGASAVAGMAPMLAGMGPVGWVTTAAVAVGGGLFLLNKNLENAAKKQAKFVDSVSATTDKMDKVGQVTQKVGASRAMDEVRKKGVFGAYNDVERAGTGFGDTFLRSEVGKSMANGFVEQMKTSGSEIAAQDFALQLASYVSDGVLDASQAADIADQIGIQLGSRKYTAEILGNLRSVIGPSGEDLANNPLRVRMQIINEANKRSGNIVNDLNDAIADRNTGRTEAAQIAALGVNNISIAKAQVDATEFQYRKQIQLLEKELESTANAEKMLSIKEKISQLQKNMASDLVVMNGEYAKQLDLEIQRFEKDIMQKGLFGTQVDNQKEDAYFDALKSKVKDVYKGTEFETMSEKTLERLAKLSDLTLNPIDSGKTKAGFKNAEEAQSFEVRMSMLLADRTLNPEQSDAFMDMFAGKLPELKETLSLGIKTKGPAATVEMLEYFTTFGDKEKAVEISTKIIKGNAKQFNDIGQTLSVLRALDGHEVNVEAFITTVGYNGLITLSNDLAKIEAMPNKLDKELILKYFTTGRGFGVAGASKENLEFLFAQWADFDKLPDKAQKEAISKFVSIYSTIFTDEASRFKYAVDEAKNVESVPGLGGVANQALKQKRYDEIMSGSLTDAAAREAAPKTEKYIGQNGELVVNSGPGELGDGSGSKSNPLAFLDQLGIRLKNVRDNAFNALKPVDSLLAAFRDKKTQQNAFKLFDGIQNRLLKMGVGQDMRDAIASLSAEDFAKVAALKGKDALFTFEKGKPRSKDTITGLTDTGKAADQGYREANLGDFNLANEVTIKNINDQTKAYGMLIANGVSASKALEIVSDEGQAAAIAGGAIKTSDPEWKTYIKNIKQANSDLERQAVLNKAIRENEDFKMYTEMPKLVSQMKSLGYSSDQINAALADPALGKFLVEDLADGKLDAKDIADYLSNIEAKKIIDIQVALNKKDLAGAAEQGRQIVDELFAAQEGLIRTGTEAMKIKANDLEISNLESQIAPFTREIEDLSEEVNDLNRQLEMNPLFGDRAIQTIQDQNSRLSNDLAVISNAAEEVNKRYDDQAEALSKVEEINANILDQQKQQIDLADAITSGDISAAARAVQEMRAGNASRFAEAQSKALQQARENALGSLVGPSSGLNQDQISAKMYENSQKIYAMETDPGRLAILNNIKTKQDKIYDIEENSIEAIQQKIDKLVDANKVLQAGIDKEISNLKALGNTRDEWDRINARIDYYSAVMTAEQSSAELGGLLSAAESLNLTWKDILTKMAEYTKGIPGAVTSAKNLFASQGSSKTSSQEETAAETSGKAAAMAAAALKAERFAEKDRTPSTLTPEEIAKQVALEAEYAFQVNQANRPEFGPGTPYEDLAIQYREEAKAAAYAGRTEKETAAAAAAMAEVLDAARKASVNPATMYQFDDSNFAFTGPAGFEGKGPDDPEVEAAILRSIDAGRARGSRGTIGSFLGAMGLSSGGIVPKYFASGGYTRGTDTIPAMLTPGEFVMSKYAVQTHGIDNMKSINSGSSIGDSVYNYNLNLNVKSDANPDEIARAVMVQIKSVDAQRLRGTRF